MQGQKGLEYGVEQELTCVVCLDLFDNPRRLDCEHSFCLGCLNKVVQSSDRSIVCPHCRTVTTLKLPGYMGVARLAEDKRSQQMLDTYLSTTGRSLQRSGEPGSPLNVTVPDATSGEPTQFEKIEPIEPCCEVLHGFLPFDLPQERTGEMFENWKRNLWLCPTDFSAKARLTSVRMLSVPFYVFHVKTQADFTAKLCCPQHGKSALPPGSVVTDVTHSRVAAQGHAGNIDPCSSHASRWWAQQAVGSTVTHTTKRDMSHDVDAGWGTWLWTQSKLPKVLRMPSAYPEAGGGGGGGGAGGADAATEVCSTSSCAAGLQQSACSSGGSGNGGDSCPSSSAKPSETCVDNGKLEISTKVGQTYVSSMQPMHRTLNLNGSHNNAYTNVLVCASYGIDHDLVAALMTGNSKDDDLALVSSIKVTPPTSEQGSTEQYLEKVLELIKESEGALSGTGKHHSDGAHSGERRKKKQTPSSSAAAAAAASSSSAGAPPSDADAAPPTKPRANGAPPTTAPRDSERASSLGSLPEPALTPNHPLFSDAGAAHPAPLAAASSFASADGAAFGGLGLAFPPPSAGGADFLAGGGAAAPGSAGKAATSGAIGGAIGLGSVGQGGGGCRNDPTAAFFDDEEDEEDDLGAAHALSPPVPMFKKEKKKKKSKGEAAPPPPPPPPQPEDLDDFPEDLIPDDDDFFATSAAPPPPEPPAPLSPTAPPSAPSSAAKEKRRSKKEKKEKERHGSSAQQQQQPPPPPPSSHVPPIPTRVEDEDFFRQPPSLVAPPEAPELPYHDVVGCAIGSATGRQSPNLIFMPDDDDDAAAKFLRAGGAGGVGSGASGGDVSPAGDDECDSPVEESAKLVAPISSTNDNHFAAGAGGAAQHTNDGDTAWLRSLKVGILPPERSSEEAWREHIWPHVQEKEVEFTQTVMQSMEPKGAVVEESQVELTVTELKQRAVLIPCYVATYTYEGRQFDLLVHGRTGEVHGKRPWMGSSTYDSVRKNVEHQVFNVRRYVEESLDNLGMGIRM